MLRLLIVGAGGWGREVLSQLQGDADYGKVWTIGGFLDTRAHILNELGCDTPILGDPLSYAPQDGDAFVCAVGLPKGRIKYAQPLLDKNALFIPVLTKASIGTRVRVGRGCLLCSYVQVSPDVWIGDFANVHTQTVIGHDVHIGDYVQIGAMVFIGGGARIGNLATIHPHATILPGIQVGEGATVGAGAVVVKNVSPGATVFGNPARVIFQDEAH